MPRTAKTRQAPAPLPQWVRPQLTAIADDAPDADQWLHEIKFDGYRLLQARGCVLHTRQPRLLAQNQMPAPRGVHHRRLDRPGRAAALARRRAAGLLRPGRPL